MVEINLCVINISLQLLGISQLKRPLNRGESEPGRRGPPSSQSIAHANFGAGIHGPTERVFRGTCIMRERKARGGRGRP